MLYYFVELIILILRFLATDMTKHTLTYRKKSQQSTESYALYKKMQMFLLPCKYL